VFCEAQDLHGRIADELVGLQIDDTAALQEASARVREMVMAEPLPGRLEESLRAAYGDLAEGEQDAAVAVRSSATLNTATRMRLHHEIPKLVRAAREHTDARS